MGDDVYQPQEPEASDPTEQLDIEDTLDDRGLTDLLDEGYSPPERPWAVEDQGTTAAEQHSGEPLESRLAREIPEVTEAAGDDVGDLSDGDGEPWDAEVGTVRATSHPAAGHQRAGHTDGRGRRDRRSGGIGRGGRHACRPGQPDLRRRLLLPPAPLPCCTGIPLRRVPVAPTSSCTELVLHRIPHATVPDSPFLCPAA